MKECSCCCEDIPDNASVCPYCGAQQISDNMPVTMDSITACVSNVQNSFALVQSVASNVSNVFQSFADLDYQVAVLDRRLEAFKAQLGADVEKYRIAVEAVRPELDKYSSMIDKFVDKILAMNDDTSDPVKIKQQTQLLDTLRDFNDRYNRLLMRLL